MLEYVPNAGWEGGSGKGMKNAQINHCAFTGNRENDISTHFLVF
jgi:hypothetical protein